MVRLRLNIRLRVVSGGLLGAVAAEPTRLVRVERRHETHRTDAQQ
jgi:hypothetical protein